MMTMATNFFQISFAQCLAVSVTKFANDVNKHLPRNSIFKDCLELDAHDMTSQILPILIDFTQDRAVTCTIFRSFFKFLNLNSSGTRRDIMHQSISSANIPLRQPPGFAKDPNSAGRDLYKPKFPRGLGICTKKCTSLKLY